MRNVILHILLAINGLFAASIGVDAVRLAPQNRLVLIEATTVSVDSSTSISGLSISAPTPSRYTSADNIQRTIEISAVDATGSPTVFGVAYGRTPVVASNRHLTVRVMGGVLSVEPADGKAVSSDLAAYTRHDAGRFIGFLAATDSLRRVELSDATWNSVPAATIAPLLGMSAGNLKQVLAKLQVNSGKTTLLLRMSIVSAYGAKNDMEMTGSMVIDPKWASVTIDLTGVGRHDKSVADAKVVIETSWRLQIVRQLQF